MKTKVILIVLIVWAVLSLGYIVNNIWSNFKNEKLAAAYQQGRVDTINTLISSVTNSCSPVPVSSGDKQLQVVNATCLSTSSNQ